MKDMIRKVLESLRRDERGQAIVELAITLPLLLLLLCGIIEMSWICANKLLIANLCRESTRYGITYAVENGDMIRARTLEMATDYMRDDLDVEVVYTVPADYREGDLIVLVRYDMPTITPIMGAILGDTFHIESACEMKIG